MRLAIALGARGLGQTWPNPSVGCIVVKDRRIVGRGWTQPGGRPHAEVRALAMAGSAAAGATAYVSLEPCAHHGKTPPCAAALIVAGVARVVFALQDPDPRVAGRGLQMLSGAGIAVTEGVEAEAAAEVHSGFLSRVTQGRPMLTLKLASSFDGRIATASGESQWITGPGARHAVHGMRASHDAVLIGAGTARADDPMLTVRGFGPLRQPLRIVAARRLDLPLDGQLARSAGQVPLWLLHDPSQVSDSLARRWSETGAKLIGVYDVEGRHLAPAAMLRALGAEGLTRVFCEGGGMLAASMLMAGLVDQVIGFTAGLALGAEGRPSIGPLGIAALDTAPRFRLVEHRALGGDVMHRWLRA